MKTIENKCEHKVVKFIGMQKTMNGVKYALGNCYYCKTTIVITNKYRKVIGKVYEVIPQETKGFNSSNSIKLKDKELNL